ncbi:MAG TPA: ATP-grasp domain-containing protein [Nitrospiria bacterium]|nr:ATP-grasp domain-containing protein [Nitrospiria bacterium]
MKKLRIAALMHEDLIPPDDLGGIDLDAAEWKTEYDVVKALRCMKHDVLPIGVRSDLGLLRKTIADFKPDIAFNLLEEFNDVPLWDQNVVSFLELMGVPYTGCNPRGLMLARDKGLSKKLLSYHRIPFPDFMVVPIGRKPRRPKRLDFPLIVKSVCEEASLGISQASIVTDDDKLRERVAFMHESVKTPAIAERYIAGRELYVGVLGNEKLQVLPIWELDLSRMPEDAPKIATRRVKWSLPYQKKYNITSGVAKDLPNGLSDRIHHLAKRVYRVLGLSGYARLDMRLDPQGHVYIIEANPNPQIGHGEDFAESAKVVGLSYKALLQRIVTLGLAWRPDRLAA